MSRRGAAFGAALLLLGTAACGSGDSAEGGDVVVTYAVWNKDQVPAIEQLAAEFEKSHDSIDVRIQLTPFEQYWTKLQAAASGGSAPDVFWMNGVNIQLYASNGMLLPLSDQIERNGVDLAAYPDSLVELYSVEDEQYGLPRDFDTVGLWYNRELFDEAGVEYPDDSWTWEDLEDAAERLTDSGAGVHGIAAALKDQENYYNSIMQAGGHIVSPDGKSSGYDDPATIEGLRFWTDLIERGHSPNLEQMTDTEPLQLFESGKVAMYYGGSWRAIELGGNEYTKGRVNVAPLPRGAERAVIVHGLANAVYAKTKHPEEAMEFLAYLGSEDAARILGETGTVIPAYDGMQEKWVASMPQFDLDVFVDALEYGVPYPMSANTAAWQADEKELLRQAWAGQKDVTTAAEELAVAMNADLDAGAR